jgi:hypothetical protein
MRLIIGDDGRVAVIVVCAIEIELELDQLHIDEVRVHRLVSDTHAHMFDLDDVSLEGVFQAVFEFDEVGYVRVLLLYKRAYEHLGRLERSWTTKTPAGKAVLTSCELLV